MTNCIPCVPFMKTHSLQKKNIVTKCLGGNYVVLLRETVKTWKADEIKIKFHEAPAWLDLISDNEILREVSYGCKQKYINSQSKLTNLINVYMSHENLTNNEIYYIYKFSHNARRNLKLLQILPRVLIVIIHNLLKVLRKKWL